MLSNRRPLVCCENKKFRTECVASFVCSSACRPNPSSDILHRNAKGCEECRLISNVGVLVWVFRSKSCNGYDSTLRRVSRISSILGHTSRLRHFAGYGISALRYKSCKWRPLQEDRLNSASKGLQHGSSAAANAQLINVICKVVPAFTLFQSDSMTVFCCDIVP